MRRVLVGSRCIQHSSYLHTYTCAHLQADTRVQALHPHTLMQTTTLGAESQLQKTQLELEILKGRRRRDSAPC